MEYRIPLESVESLEYKYWPTTSSIAIDAISLADASLAKRLFFHLDTLKSVTHAVLHGHTKLDEVFLQQ